MTYKCSSYLHTMFFAMWISLTHCLLSKSYPTLIHGLKQNSKYEIISQTGYQKPKKWQLEHSDWKIFCNEDKTIRCHLRFSFNPAIQTTQYLDLTDSFRGVKKFF